MKKTLHGYIMTSAQFTTYQCSHCGNLTGVEKPPPRNAMQRDYWKLYQACSHCGMPALVKVYVSGKNVACLALIKTICPPYPGT